jgi:hypothetical protein
MRAPAAAVAIHTACESQMKRFDIVVFNHDRLDCWLRNADRIQGFTPSIDRITVVSSSPSEEERSLVRNFEAEHGFRVRYLTRKNRGLAELARIDYFTGRVGSLEENLAYEFIFQMQDHYLDTVSDASRWGPELDHRIKGDVVPDGVVFDLSTLYQKLRAEDLSRAFCDRNNPCWFTLGRRRYIAPNGGNFIIESSKVRGSRVRRLCESLRDVCDDSYDWAVYVEFMWGVAFFEEGQKCYDIKRERTFSLWQPDLFYIAPDDVRKLHARYGPGVAAGLRRRRRWVSNAGRSALRRLRTAFLPSGTHG